MNTSASQQRRRSAFLSVSIGHLAIDIFNSLGPVLLAQLRLVMGLSTAQVGLAVGLYQLLAGATQPLFGWLVDRGGSKRLGPASVAWVIVLVALAAVLGPHLGFLPFLAIFSLAAVGSGAFHPQGTMHASLAIPGRESTTTAIFFFCGQVGLFLGPVLAGLTIQRVGLGGIGWLALLVLPVPVWMAVRMGRSGSLTSTLSEGDTAGRDDDSFVEGPGVGLRGGARVRGGTAPANKVEAGKLALDATGIAFEPVNRVASSSMRVVVHLAAIFSLRAWVFLGTAAFLPLLFQAGGASPARQGLITGVFWLGGGFTGVVAGWVADRSGRRAVAAVSTMGGSVLLLFLPGAQGSAAVLLAMLCGGLLGAPHSLLMVLAQDLLPVRRGLASGYALGFLFSMGALASWGIGLLAGYWPLETVIRSGLVPGLLAAILLLFLPSSRTQAAVRGVGPTSTSHGELL